MPLTNACAAVLRNLVYPTLGSLKHRIQQADMLIYNTFAIRLREIEKHRSGLRIATLRFSLMISTSQRNSVWCAMP